MERREALRNMAVTVWGLVALPACGLIDSNRFGPLNLTATQLETLTMTVDTFIPATDTPGAVELEVDGFLQNALAHCYEKSDQTAYIKGLDMAEAMATENFNAPFAKCTTEDRINILSGMEKAEDETYQSFYQLSKELTVLGFTTSEYVMTNLTDYKMVPGHYHGCVPYEPKTQEKETI